MRDASIRYAVAPCALGFLLVAATRRGVCNVRFGDGPDELVAGLREEFPWAELRAGGARVEAWLAALRSALAGDPRPLRLPLDVRGSQLQRRVWAAIAAIPSGETRTYGELARALGRPRAARAVARACAANPVALAIPCHRVVPVRGGTGGYRWGRARKAALLAAERAPEEALWPAAGRAPEETLLAAERAPEALRPAAERALREELFSADRRV